MLNTKYIAPDDFKAFAGIDLNIELRDGDYGGDKAAAFLLRIERRMEAYLSANFFRKVDEEYPALSDYQKEHYKRALLEQALYVIKNGDISTDGGYDPERGPVAKVGDLKARVLAPNARDELIACGLLNRHIMAAPAMVWWW